MSGAFAAWLPDGKRLHFQHGPIDLIIEAAGAADCVDLAYRAAWARFETVLAELVEELPRLRTLCPPEGLGLKGAVARRMENAVKPHTARMMTPMAAVAGAVADEILDVMLSAADLDRAYVNNGGDVALHLCRGESFRAAMIGQGGGSAHLGTVLIEAGGPRGLATSGRHGRSFSLGIADSVTVLAQNAAAADAAATLIANAVDLPGNPAIERVPANELDPDSDLGNRLVTVDVTRLSSAETERALSSGRALANAFVANQTITAAALYLEDQSQTAGIWPNRSAIKEFSARMLADPPRQANDCPL